MKQGVENEREWGGGVRGERERRARLGKMPFDWI